MQDEEKNARVSEHRKGANCALEEGARAKAASLEAIDALPQPDAHGPHEDAQEHHHHTHATNSVHPGHHHLLSVEHLSVSFNMYDDQASFFQAEKRDSCVIDDLTLSVHEGEILALVGASGSGKSLLADSIMGLFEPNATVKGTIWFDGFEQDAQSLAKLRGRGISLVPQSVAHLDPLMRVGKQVEGFAQGAGAKTKGRFGFRAKADEDRGQVEVNAARSARVANIVRDARDSRHACAAQVVRPTRAARVMQADRAARRKELFARYRLDESVARMYPHELSGGMARRVLLCCALMDDPRLIVADEPTPGLDLPLAVAAMQDFRSFADRGGSVLLITHDIELALQVADRVAVFKDGSVVEETSVESFKDPSLLRHPFTRALWHALPEHGFTACPNESLEEPPC
ncbi:MAG: ATP-binding cassette domain-containing protein [Coriobacteriia bacterium]|nr:ATP-binding cassette domain-containing protein [Coriobacteriia bacterium]